MARHAIPKRAGALFPSYHLAESMWAGSRGQQQPI